MKTRAAWLPGVCDPETVMTFVGLDTRAGRRVFGGSVGPGPVLAF